MIETTLYYEEFCRYFQMAKEQQTRCNLGFEPYENVGDDDLMKNVHLYDVVNRKYAGFSQIIHDCYYGWAENHPYWHKMKVGAVTRQREQVANDWSGKWKEFQLAEWLYVFLMHRVCGSGINYSVKPSGYHNTLLIHLHQCRSIEDMAELVNNYPAPFYTSVGYQFPQFPKPPAGSRYKRGGDYYLTEFAPRLCRELADWLTASNAKKDLREVGDFMFAWNKKNGLSAYRFQYAAFIADIADWYPDFINLNSPFYYGSNAIECISYLAKPTKKMKTEDFLDKVMEKIYADTGAFPYDAEDVCCDFIRWVENYVRPGGDYDHLDLDEVFSSSRISDHPFGRQQGMLRLGLVKSFRGMGSHPSDDAVIRQAGITVEEYKRRLACLTGS